MDPVNESGMAVGWITGKLAPPQWIGTFLVKGTFTLAPGSTLAPAPVQEEATGDLHAGDDPAGLLRYPQDFGLVKPRSDFIVLGTCHAPGKVPVTVCPASIGIGSYRKGLAVIGDRRWRWLRGPTSPEPFVALPIGYDRAYGGLGFDRNPLGRGVHWVPSPDGKSHRPLPNVEFPDRLIVDPDEPAEPAGFGPISMTWPQRAKLAGSFGRSWEKKRWPWFPEDFDPGFFNAAPADQQLPKPFRGDETMTFENLHPEQARITSRLPGLRARIFLRELIRGVITWREVPLKLDTVWVDLDAGQGVLVWRGHVPVLSQKLDEVDRLFAVAEPLGEERSAEHYRGALASALARRLQEELELEVEEPEEEEEPEVPEPEEPEEVEEVEEADEESPGPPPPPETPEETYAQLVEMKERLVAMEKPVPPALEAQIEAMKIEEAEPEEEPDEPEEPEEIEPPEELTREQILDVIGRKGNLDGQDLTGFALAGADLGGVSLREAILMNVDLTGGSLKGADLTGAALAGAILAGVDASEANFAGADLAGANLDAASLQGANLQETDLSEASLRGARLIGAKAQRAILPQADLSLADLAGADFSDADLSEVRLHGTSLKGATLARAALSGAWGRRVNADEADLTKVKAAGASLVESSFRGIAGEGSVWEGGQLTGCDFSRARLAEAEFTDAYLGAARLDAADARGGVFDGVSLAGARIRRANLLGASIQKADLSRADFTESNLYDALLYDAATETATFEGANLRKARTGSMA